MNRVILLLCSDDWMGVFRSEEMPAAVGEQRDRYFGKNVEDEALVFSSFLGRADHRSPVILSEIIKISRDLLDAEVESTVMAIRLVPLNALLDDQKVKHLRRWLTRMFDRWRLRTPHQRVVRVRMLTPFGKSAKLGELNLVVGGDGKSILTPFRRGFATIVGESEGDRHTMANDAGKLHDCQFGRFYKKPGSNEREGAAAPIHKTVNWKFDIVPYFIREYGMRSTLTSDLAALPRLVDVLIDMPLGESRELDCLAEFIQFEDGRSTRNANLLISMSRDAPPRPLGVRANFDAADLTDYAYLAMKGTKPTILVVDKAREDAVSEAWAATRPIPQSEGPYTHGSNFMMSIKRIAERLGTSRDESARESGPGRPSYLVVSKDAEVVTVRNGRFTVPLNPFVIWDCIWEAAFQSVIPNEEWA